MTPYERLISWRNSQIKEDEPLFLGLPEAWADDLTFACENGHVSTRYLKSERQGFDACLECGKNVLLVPPSTTEVKLNQALTKGE